MLLFIPVLVCTPIYFVHWCCFAQHFPFYTCITLYTLQRCTLVLLCTPMLLYVSNLQCTLMLLCTACYFVHLYYIVHPCYFVHLYYVVHPVTLYTLLMCTPMLICTPCYFVHLCYFQVLETTHSHKRTKKVSDALHQIGQGLVDNDSLAVDALLTFVYALTKEVLPGLKVAL